GRDRVPPVGAVHPRRVLRARRAAPLLHGHLEALRAEPDPRPAARPPGAAARGRFRPRGRQFVTERALARRPLALRVRAAVETPVVVPVVVGGLLLAAFVARVLLARHVLAPWIMPDELVYGETSRSFRATGHFLFRDQPEALRTIYPAL